MGFSAVEVKPVTTASFNSWAFLRQSIFRDNFRSVLDTKDYLP